MDVALLYPKRKKHGPCHDRLIEIFRERLGGDGLP